MLYRSRIIALLDEYEHRILDTDDRDSRAECYKFLRMELLPSCAKPRTAFARRPRATWIRPPSWAVCWMRRVRPLPKRSGPSSTSGTRLPSPPRTGRWSPSAAATVARIPGWTPRPTAPSAGSCPDERHRRTRRGVHAFVNAALTGDLAAVRGAILLAGRRHRSKSTYEPSRKDGPRRGCRRLGCCRSVHPPASGVCLRGCRAPQRHRRPVDGLQAVEGRGVRNMRSARDWGSVGRAPDKVRSVGIAEGKSNGPPRRCPP